MRKTARQPQVVFYMPTAGALLHHGAPPPGGAENQVGMLAAALAHRGHGVVMVVFAEGVGLPQRIGEVDVIAQRLPRTRLPGIRTLLYYAGTLRLLLASPARSFVQRTAGVHTFLVALAARLGRRRFVYSSASDLDFDFAAWERRRWVAWLFRAGVRLASEIVVQTDEQATLCRQRFGREPVLIKSIAEPAPQRTVSPEAFLWVGRLLEYKRPLAYVALARAVPEARFWMVGLESSSAEGQRVAAEVRRASRELPNLELLAPRPRVELAPLVDRAVAIVSTSATEGMPNVFLEGWSRGVPALARSHDPDGLIAREGLGGFASGNPERLSELAQAMWEDRDDQRELAERCRIYVTREHSRDGIAARWAQTLELDGA